MLQTIDLDKVFGGAGSSWGTGGFWTGRTRDDEDRAAHDSSGLGAGGFWTGRTRREQELGTDRWREEMDEARGVGSSITPSAPSVPTGASDR
ncbi:MAG TPA: hypothetical protein VL326_30215 [Kofleriaceae bacterium]|jgi:hypothetical protein|nr:hypothetical protein [Kofleriaceae bacterium]